MRLKKECDFFILLFFITLAVIIVTLPMRILILLVFFFSHSVCVLGQGYLNENCRAAYDDIISYKLDDARLKLEQEKVNYPDNPYIFYLNNYIDFLIAFIGEDEKAFERLIDMRPSRMRVVELLDASSPLKNYMLGNIYLQSAMARIKFHEYFTGMIEVNKAYHLLDQNLSDFPEFAPNLISMGALHIMIGLVPDQYQWALKLIDIEGSVAQGTAELYQVLAQSKEDTYSYLRKESLFYIGLVELNLNPDKDKARQLLAELKNEPHKGLLLDYLEINMLMRLGRNDAALEILEGLDQRDAYAPFDYLDYLHGECLLRKMETQPALDYYLRFLSNFKGRNYIKDSWRKMAWIAILSEDTAAYYSYLRTATQSGYDDVDLDKEAGREAQKADLPNADLLKARILFDGGYYIKAAIILDQMNLAAVTRIEEVERNYRYARIAHQRNQIERAIEYYKISLEMGAGFDRYFAANAALKLGEIYENLHQPEAAFTYYNRCLNLEFDEYRNSIRSKAKEGINRLGQHSQP